MLPAASVSGLYFSHPQAKYFNIGRVGRDQAEAYARRKGVPVEEVERWLAPNLAYEPAAVAGGRVADSIGGRGLGGRRSQGSVRTATAAPRLRTVEPEP